MQRNWEVTNMGLGFGRPHQEDPNIHQSLSVASRNSELNED